MKAEVCPGAECLTCGFRSEVFASLPDYQLEELSRSKLLKHAKKGETIAHQNDRIEGFIFLRDGLAKLCRMNAEGREQIVGIATPNDFVGLLSLFSSNTYNYSIVAIEDSSYCSVEYDMVMNLVGSNGEFARNLLAKISRVSDLLIGGRLDIDLLQLRGRVAYILCFFANEIYHSTRFNLPVSRREIAELIDMRVENVVRILSEFRRDKIILIEGTYIEILDKEKLNWAKRHG
jgi:CRP/FNR family transcriptional regulator